MTKGLRKHFKSTRKRKKHYWRKVKRLIEDETIKGETIETPIVRGPGSLKATVTVFT